MQKDKIILVGLSVFILCSTMLTGCIETSGTLVEEELGPGLTRLPDGRLAIDPGMFGENLIYDGYNLSAVDMGGSGGSSVVTTNNYYDDHFNRSAGTLYTEVDGDNLDVNGTIDADRFDDGSLTISGGYIDFPGLTGGIRNCQEIELYGAIDIGGDYVLDAYYRTLHNDLGNVAIDFYHNGVISFENCGLQNISRVKTTELWGTNASFTQNISVGGMLLNGSYNEFETYISNSNGKYWPATAPNIKKAGDDLNNETGWVFLPAANMTVSDVILLGDNIHIFGRGDSTILYVEDNANCSVFRNYNWNGGGTNSHIEISDLKIDGNGLNQPEWHGTTAGRSPYAHAIFMEYVDHVNIHDITVVDSHSSGVWLGEGHNATIRDCYLEDIGQLYANSGTYTHWWSKGIMLQDWYDGKIIDNTIHGAYAGGIAFETVDAGTDVDAYTHDIIIKGNTVSDSNAGLYCEWGRDCIISENIVSDCSNTDVYASAADCLVFADSVYRMTVTDNHFHIGSDGTESNAISSRGSDNMFKGNMIYGGQGGDGIYHQGGDNNTFSYNHINDCNADPFQFEDESGDDPQEIKITNNMIHGGGNWAKGIRLMDSCNNFTIAFNTFISTSTNYPRDGVYEGSSCDYNRILFNDFQNTWNEEVHVAGSNTRVNCTGYDDWNFYDGVS